METSEAIRIKRRIIKTIKSYAHLAYGWDIADEDDFSEFEETILNDITREDDSDNEDVKTFTATVEERYVWNCPYCGELCDSVCEDPADMEENECEHCGEISQCKYTER